MIEPETKEETFLLYDEDLAEEIAKDLPHCHPSFLDIRKKEEAAELVEKLRKSDGEEAKAVLANLFGPLSPLKGSAIWADFFDKKVEKSEGSFAEHFAPIVFNDPRIIELSQLVNQLEDSQDYRVLEKIAQTAASIEDVRLMQVAWGYLIEAAEIASQDEIEPPSERMADTINNAAEYPQGSRIPKSLEQTLQRFIFSAPPDQTQEKRLAELLSSLEQPSGLLTVALASVAKNPETKKTLQDIPAVFYGGIESKELLNETKALLSQD